MSNGSSVARRVSQTGLNIILMDINTLLTKGAITDADASAAENAIKAIPIKENPNWYGGTGKQPRKVAPGGASEK